MESSHQVVGGGVRGAPSVLVPSRSGLPAGEQASTEAHHEPRRCGADYRDVVHTVTHVDGSDEGDGTDERGVEGGDQAMAHARHDGPQACGPVVTEDHLLVVVGLDAIKHCSTS